MSVCNSRSNVGVRTLLHETSDALDSPDAALVRALSLDALFALLLQVPASLVTNGNKLANLAVFSLTSSNRAPRSPSPLGCSVAAATRACFHWERVHAERRWGARGTIRGRERGRAAKQEEEMTHFDKFISVHPAAQDPSLDTGGPSELHRCRERGPEQRGERK
jgi:hypothetical protein